MQKSVMIVSLARTPIGNLLGELKDFSGHQLGSHAIKSALERSTLHANEIDELIMGCVLPAGQGQAPARQAALNAGLLAKTPCTTLNKVCGSGMKAITLLHDMILTRTISTAIGGGMESMSNAPYLLAKARQGYRLGKSELFDHMMIDGLEDAYDKERPMGYFAEQCVKQYGFTRKQQDHFATQSFVRARKATENGKFIQEIAPITTQNKHGSVIIDKDEHPFSVSPEKIPSLKPVFLKEGTITAGNASSIADGAAALLLMHEEMAIKRGIKPIARIIGHSNSAKAPTEFTTAPIDATRSLLDKINWKVDEVDLYEINEAFAVVALAFMQTLKIPHEKINIHGGGCALGHPIGASGARIIITLINALQLNGLKRGIATLCIGGGEATAIAVEMV